MANENERSFKITSEEVAPPASLEAWQVVIKLTNKHGVGIGGKVYARVGATEEMSQLVGVLPDLTTTFDFRHSSGPITKIYTRELTCTHQDQKHVFSFEIPNPKNGGIYSGTAN